MAAVRQTSAGPRRDPCALVLSPSQPAPLSPVFPSPLRSGPLSPATSRRQAACPPPWRPCPSLPCSVGGSPPALPAPGSGAFSACSSHPHSCWERRKGGRARRGWIRRSRFGARSQLRENSARRGAPAPLQLFLSAAELRALARVWPLPFRGRRLWLFRSPLACPASAVALPTPRPALCSLTAAPCYHLPLTSRWRWRGVAGSAGAVRRGARRHSIPPPQPGQASGSGPGGEQG